VAHVAFEIMVGAGVAMLGWAAVTVLA